MRWNVLLVDDVTGIRALLKLVLHGTGRFVVVGTAGDGREAVRLAEVLQPHVVLLDLSMPEMDGLEALPRIRVVAPTALVFVMSGFDRERMESEVMALGARGYLEKGMDPDEIVETLLAGVEAAALDAL